MKGTFGRWDGEKPLFFFAHFSDPHEPYNSHAKENRLVQFNIDGIEVDTIPSDKLSFWEKKIKLPPGKHQIELISKHKFKLRFFRCLDGDKRIETEWQQEDGGVSHKPINASLRKVGTLVRPETADATSEEVEIKLWLNDSLSPDEIRTRYAREVTFVDEYVGKVVSMLKQRGIYDESLIIFTSDHGEALGEHKSFGHAQNLTDDMIAVPMIIKLPKGSVFEGELDPRRLVRHMDVVPTAMQILGVPPLPGQKGISLLQPIDPDKPLLHLAQTHTPEAHSNKLSYFDGRHKLIYNADKDDFRLFDLQNDPGEENDISAKATSQHLKWKEQLSELAELTAVMRRDEATTDPALQEKLNALGYGGDDEE